MLTVKNYHFNRKTSIVSIVQRVVQPASIAKFISSAFAAAPVQTFHKL